MPEQKSNKEILEEKLAKVDQIKELSLDMIKEYKQSNNEEELNEKLSHRETLIEELRAIGKKLVPDSENKDIKKRIKITLNEIIEIDKELRVLVNASIESVKGSSNISDNNKLNVKI